MQSLLLSCSAAGGGDGRAHRTAVPSSRGSDGAVHQVPQWQTPFCLESSEKETPRWVLKGEETFFRLVSEEERVLAKGIVHARVPNIACLVKAMWLLSMGKEF